MSDDEDKVECPYCGEEFESKEEEGVHRAEEHVTSEGIVQPKRKHHSDKNIVKGWKEDSE